MYKLSKYNYFVEYNQRIICFNGLTGIIFSVSKEEYKQLIILWDDLVLFHIQYNSVFNRFKEWGFIVDDEINEIDFVKFKNKQSVFLDRLYRLIIIPTEECVFNCWYCFNHQDGTGHMQKDVQNRIKKHIKFMIEKEKITGLFLDWFGGEPLMCFDKVVYPIAKFALEQSEQHRLPYRHHITTNAYLITPEMVRKMKEIKLNSFQITIDGDEKRHNAIRNVNGRPSFARIMENIELLCESMTDIQIILRLNYDEKTLLISDMKKVFTQIPEKYRQSIFLDFQRVWQTIKKDKQVNNPIRQDLYKYCNSIGYNPILTSSFQIGRSLRCYADRFYHTVINFNGKIYRCAANMKAEDGFMNENGIIEWNHKSLVQMFGNSTFENNKCLNCKHLPICVGPCIQKTKNKNKEIECVLNGAEITPEQFVIGIYEQTCIKK